MSRSHKYVMSVSSVAVLLVAVAAFLVWGRAFSPAEAQVVSPGLNENCVVSILNRTARVQPDGSWVLPNVPAGFGQVRARATCVENGVTRSGQSDFFTIAPGRMNAIVPIPLGEFQPIPASIAVTAESTLLESVGESVQLAVMATYSDGTVGDITPADSGTNYTTSNPAIASVSEDGLVTALSSGTVAISAINEGALGVIRIQVTLSGDSDGDGIDDDVELAAGLNPNDPLDAIEDIDNDGLTNKQELVDFGTDHLNPDTDGDEFTDGDEVANGIDPIDRTNSDLSNALVSIEVDPPGFFLVVNTIEGEASQQISVFGNLKAGLVLDLTSTTSGTNYNSSDLSVCNFGAPDGRVFGGSDGTCVLTITNLDFSANVVGAVRTFAPTALSFVTIPGPARNVDVNGDYAYVAAGTGGLHVIDVSDRLNPAPMASVDTNNANDVKIVNGMAYVADGSAGLAIIDVSDPVNPGQPSWVDTPGEAMDVVVKDNLAYVADGSAGLQVIDIASQTIVGSVDTPGNAVGVDVGTDIGVIADLDQGIHVVDLSDVPNLSNDSILGSFDTGDAADAAISAGGQFLFVADTSSGFTSVDISDPGEPTFAASVPQETGGRLNDVVTRGEFAFGADFFFVNGVPIIHVGDPSNPTPRAILNFTEFRDDDGTGIAVDDSFVYLTTFRDGDSRLYIGQYRETADNLGDPPVISIAMPAPNDAVIEGSRARVVVSTSEETDLAAVHLLINDQVVSTDTLPPLGLFTFVVPEGSSTLTVGAIAVDLANNVGFAPNVSLNVAPDPLTSVTGTAVDLDGVPIAGATVSITDDLSSVTDGAGEFIIDGVPSVAGEIAVTATAEIDGFQSFNRSRRFEPVASGITNVGNVVLAKPKGGSLYPGPKFLTGVSPQSVAVEDFNFDGIADIVAANFGAGTGSGQVSVLLGNGNGTFGEEQRYFVNTRPRAVTVDDVNLDTIPDIVTADDGSAVFGAGPSNVSVLLGNGDGTFQVRKHYTIGGRLPSDVVVADVNLDSAPDIIVPHSSSGGVDDLSILYGDGNDGFLPAQTYAVGGFPSAAAVADVDMDGAPDILTTNGATNRVSVLHGDGSGFFHHPVTFGIGAASESIVVGDLNLDGRLDIVTTNRNSGDVSVLIGNGDGSFQNEQRIGQFLGHHSAAISDINGDGSLDIVTAADPNAGSLGLLPAFAVVFLGNGDGTFQEHEVYQTGGGPREVVIADFNFDGVPDVVTGNAGSGDVSVLIGNGDGTLQDGLISYDLFVTPFSIAVGNLDAGSVPDAVITASDPAANGVVSTYLGSGNASFSDPQHFPIGVNTSPESVTIAKIDDDEFADVVLTNVGLGEVAVLLGGGDGTLGEAESFSTGVFPAAVAVVDLNLDLKIDLVTANRGSNDISVLLGNGDGTFQEETRYPVGVVPWAIDVGNLNDDNFPDVFTANYNSHSVSVLLGNGDGTLQSETRFSTAANPRALGIGHMNDDGIIDVVTASSSLNDNFVSVLLGNADGTLQARKNFGIGSRQSFSLSLADVNDDENLDVIAASGLGGVSLLLGNGDGTLQPVVRHNAGLHTAHSPVSVAVADINGDGRPDIVTANQGGGAIILLLQISQ